MVAPLLGTKAPTKMVLVDIGAADPQALEQFLSQGGVLLHASREIRLVTHLDVGESDINTFVAAFKAFFKH